MIDTIIDMTTLMSKEMEKKYNDYSNYTLLIYQNLETKEFGYFGHETTLTSKGSTNISQMLPNMKTITKTFLISDFQVEISKYTFFFMKFIAKWNDNIDSDLLYARNLL